MVLAPQSIFSHMAGTHTYNRFREASNVQLASLDVSLEYRNVMLLHIVGRDKANMMCKQHHMTTPLTPSPWDRGFWAFASVL